MFLLRAPAHSIASILGFALLLLGAAPASALQFTLDTEFDSGVAGSHATVDVTASGGGLDFVVSLTGSDLGAGADLHVFYFNLAGSPTNVTLSSTQAVNTAFSLALSPPVAGGAGSSFEYGVHFGNGAGPPASPWSSPRRATSARTPYRRLTSWPGITSSSSTSRICAPPQARRSPSDTDPP